MAFQVSPGVLVQEKDLTSIIPSLSTSIGGIVIASSKGQANTIVEVSSERDLVNNFGIPDNTNASSWYTAANFLKYSGALKVVRAIDETAALNASGSAGVAGKEDAPPPWRKLYQGLNILTFDVRQLRCFEGKSE